MIEEDSELSAETRVGIYSNAWFLRIFESLQEDYEALALSMGKRLFLRCVQDYLVKYPSSSYTLAHTGNRMPEFLQSWENPKNLPFYFFLASVERAGYQAFQARDPISWDLSGVLESDVSRLELKTEASVSLVHSQFHLQKVLDGKRCKKEAGDEYWLVYRQDFKVKRVQISCMQFQVLKAIAKGVLLEPLIDAFPEERTVAFLSDWASCGVIRATVI